MMQTTRLQSPISSLIKLPARVLILTQGRLREATVERTQSVPIDVLGHPPADLFHEPVTWEDAEWQ